MIKIGIGGSEGQIGNEKGFWLIQKGAKIIFEAVLKTFAGIEYDYVEPNIRM